MFIDFVDAEDDDFIGMIKSIRCLFWPEERFKNKISELGTVDFNEIIKKVSEEKLYNFGGVENVMPFVEHYYKHFSIRKDNYSGAIDDKDFLIAESKCKNYGNFLHFNNVVMIVARLIQFFQRNAAGIRLGPDINNDVLIYQRSPAHNKRIFSLMLSAFYHDIGKTIVDPRHGMEGAILLASHTTSSVFHFKSIFESHRLEAQKRDVLLIADFLAFHDLFGTLSTGEHCFMGMIDPIHRISRFTTNFVSFAPYRDDFKRFRKEHLEWNERLIFDLWLLNLADILASAQPEDGPDNWKYSDQTKIWENYNLSEERIRAFLSKPQGDLLKHDLRTALNLVKTNCEYYHAEFTKELEERARNETLHHGVERIRRLIVASLTFSDKETKDLSSRISKMIEKKCGQDADHKCSKEKIERCLADLLKGVKGIEGEHGQMVDSIIGSIEHVSGLQEFLEKFSWVGQMDYALNFFKEIAKHALMAVTMEHCKIPGAKQTGWYRPQKDDNIDSDYLIAANGGFFVQNYSSIVTTIIWMILLKGGSNQKYQNIEFKEASSRLTTEKKDRIIGLEGPYRANEAIRFVLGTVFIYYSY
ncbi:MAG: HAMP domain-containing histidine kinase [Magnetococcales bacterium]|nr:HAMP domain-containing histidine kinase [Magnetococcales bacterium]